VKKDRGGTGVLVAENLNTTCLKYLVESHFRWESSIYHRIPLSTAERHNHIKPYLYALWLDGLIAAARSIDPLFDAEILWRETLQPD